MTSAYSGLSARWISEPFDFTVSRAAALSGSISSFRQHSEDAALPFSG